MADETHQFWECIDREIEYLARRELAVRRGIVGPDFDDIKQAAACKIVVATRKDPELLARFQESRLRRGYIATCLRLTAYEWYRKARNQRAALDLQPDRQSQVEPQPIDKLIRREIADRRREIAGELKAFVRDLPVDNNARFAYEVVEKLRSVRAYATDHGISVRTARRRFVDGIMMLRKHVQQLDGGR